MEIVYGREEATGKVRVVVDGKVKIGGKENCLPSNVEKQHIKILVCDDDTLIVENLNIDNYTFVNGIGIERKRIKRGESIEMGLAHSPMNWKLIDPIIPAFADIRPLKAVWETYQDKLMKRRVSEKRKNIIRLLATVVSGFLSYLITYKVISFPNWASVPIGVIVGLIVIVYMWRDAQKSIKDEKKLEEWFMSNYRCPKCHSYFDKVNYVSLSQKKTCSFCNAVFIKQM